MNSAQFDVAIVGAGAAGCVLARRLSETGGRSVILLEAGPDVRDSTPPALRDGWGLPRGDDWPYDWGFVSEPDANDKTNPVRRGRVVGGTSWLTRFAVRGAAIDFDAWRARGNLGWSFAEVLPFFRLAESDAEFGDLPWHGNNGPLTITRYPSLERSDIHQGAVEAMTATGIPAVADHNSPDAVGVGPMPMSTRDGRRITPADVYLPDHVKLPRLTIRPNTTVASVTVENARATGVRLLDGTLVNADAVILSAGTYGSPVILMRSGIGPSEHLKSLGINVVANLAGVGSNLADHSGLAVDVGWRGQSRPAAPILHSIATFRSTGRGTDRSPDLMFWIADPGGSDPEFTIDLVLLKPESRGEVRLRSADPNVAPRIRLPGLTAAIDVTRMADGHRLAVQVANEPAIRQLARERAPSAFHSENLGQRITAEAWSIPHVVGTCRMGPAPADGDVVDAAGRVHEISRLFVADASIIPEPPAGFPHMITIMLAERLAALM